jgi:hypothetical protein
LVSVEEGFELHRLTQDLPARCNEAVDLLICQMEVGADVVEIVALGLIGGFLEIEFDKVEADWVLRRGSLLGPPLEGEPIGPKKAP